MPTMQEVLADDAKRKALINDCTVLIDEEVQSKSGLSGIAIKTGYKVVKGIKPTMIPDSVDSLLSPFTSALQPLIDEAKSKGGKISDYFVDNRSRVAEALLAITDKRAESTRHKVVKGAYEKLRPSAKKHVEEAVPRVGRLIEKYSVD